MKKNSNLLGFSKNELSDSPEMLLNKYCYKITVFREHGPRRRKKDGPGMLRKAALTVLLLALASSAFASDLRVEGAKSYVLGFLAGNAEEYSSFPAIRDDALFVLRRMTYPLSSWSWAQAFIESASVTGTKCVLSYPVRIYQDFFRVSVPKPWKSGPAFCLSSRKFRSQRKKSCLR